MPATGPTDVLKLADLDRAALAALLAGYGLTLCEVARGEPIPGSYWGEPEAGLVGCTVYARADTPLHSALHEAGHAILMGEERRRALVRDAGGDHAEEDAVCYLQVLLAGAVEGAGRARMWRDMDAWGYTFRLGSARRWFEEDAGEARRLLIGRRLARMIDDGAVLAPPPAAAQRSQAR